MPVFIVNEISGPEAFLDEEESHHLVKVIRLKPGDPVELVDGKGRFMKGVISEANPGRSRVKILEIHDNHLARDYYLHVAIAPTKSMDRFEWFLEKATEIGIDEITPMHCRRSERNRIRHERSERILLAAMKQSGRAVLPRLNPMIPFMDVIRSPEEGRKFIAHFAAQAFNLSEPAAERSKSWLVLIGPEGDFTNDEIERAVSAGFQELNLGEAVYRTETAGLIACHMVHFINRGK